MSPDLHHHDRQAMRAVEGVFVPRSMVNRFNEKGPDDAGHSRPVPPAGSGHERGRQMDEVMG